MTTLAAVAAVTERIGILSSALVLPAHDEVLIAKQAATIDVLSRGRLRLGVCIGGRSEDCRIVGRSARSRSLRMREQALRMRAIWRGQPPVDGGQPVGPAPVQRSGPPLLAAVGTPAAISSAATWADGVIAWSFGPDPSAAGRIFTLADSAWRAAGRDRLPARIVGFYCALGAHARGAVARFVGEYHAELGERAVADLIARTRGAAEADLREALLSFAGMGTHEVLLVPVLAEIEQLARLERLIAQGGWQ